MSIVNPNGPPNEPPHDEAVPRGWVHLAALAGLTVVGLVVCVLLAWPFLPALAWATALAIIAHPLHRWVSGRVSTPTIAAIATTTVVVLVVIVPVLLMAERLASEADAASQKAREMSNGGWRQAIAGVPWLDNLYTRVSNHINVEAEARQVVRSLLGDMGRVVSGSVWWLLQALVAVFVLFFAFRDQQHLLAGLRRFLPVGRAEADFLFTRTSDAVHATVYATIVTGALQGLTGGLLFWFLGVPGALLWGIVMFVLGILPIVGAFLVWVPVAVGLAFDERWGAALGVVAWGVVMAGPVNNYVYAYLAGDRLRLHPVPSLLAFIGGLAVFGVTGMVLGPVFLAVTLALIDMWRRRAEPPAQPVSQIVTEPASA